MGGHAKGILTRLVVDHWLPCTIVIGLCRNVSAKISRHVRPFPNQVGWSKLQGQLAALNCPMPTA